MGDFFLSQACPDLVNLYKSLIVLYHYLIIIKIVSSKPFRFHGSLTLTYCKWLLSKNVISSQYILPLSFMRVARGHQSRFISQDLLRAIDDVVFLSPLSHLETLQESWKYAISGHIKYLSGTCRMSRRIKRAERHEVFGTIGAGYINGSVASNACDGGMASNLLSSCELRQWWGCSRSLTWHSSELVTLFLAVRRRYRRRFTISSPRHLFRKLLSRWDFLQFRKLTNSSSWPRHLI